MMRFLKNENVSYGLLLSENCGCIAVLWDDPDCMARLRVKCCVSLENIQRNAIRK